MNNGFKYNLFLSSFCLIIYIVNTQKQLENPLYWTIPALTSHPTLLSLLLTNRVILCILSLIQPLIPSISKKNTLLPSDSISILFTCAQKGIFIKNHLFATIRFFPFKTNRIAIILPLSYQWSPSLDIHSHHVDPFPLLRRHRTFPESSSPFST